MEDNKIIELYWERSETAITETQNKYGRYCHYIAYNILYSNEDSEECVNDTYLRAWDSMPPHRPERLSAFLGKITRNLALDRYHRSRAQKRSSNVEVALGELEECIPDVRGGLSVADEIVLRDAINGFLASLPVRTRKVFVRRYWYLSTVKDIACDLDMSESNVKVLLLRTRQRFKSYLEKEGIVI